MLLLNVFCTAAAVLLYFSDCTRRGITLKIYWFFLIFKIHLLLLLYFCTSQIALEGHHLKYLLIFFIFKFIYCCCCTSVFVRLHSKGTCPFVRHRSLLTPAANADSPPTPPRIQNPDPADRRAQKLYMWNSLVACMSNIFQWTFATNANSVSPHSDLSGTKFDSLSSSRNDFRD